MNLKPKTPEELITIIDENYDYIMDDVKFTFDVAGKGNGFMDPMILAKFSERPVLHHLLQLHYARGATFMGNEFFKIAATMGEIRRPEDIASAMLNTAISCANFTGNAKNAEPYLDNGRGR